VSSDRQAGLQRHAYFPLDAVAEDFRLGALHPVRLSVAVLGPIDAEHRDVLEKKIVDAHLRDDAAGKPDDDEAAAKAQRPQRAGKDVAADDLYRDMRAVASGERKHLLANRVARHLPGQVD